MKALIVREVSRRDLEHHLKLGKGVFARSSSSCNPCNWCGEAATAPAKPGLARSAAAARRLETGVGRRHRGADRCLLQLRKAENALQMMRDDKPRLAGRSARSRAAGVEHGIEDWPSKRRF